MPWVTDSQYTDCIQCTRLWWNVRVQREGDAQVELQVLGGRFATSELLGGGAAEESLSSRSVPALELKSTDLVGEDINSGSEQMVCLIFRDVDPDANVTNAYVAFHVHDHLSRGVQ